MMDKRKVFCEECRDDVEYATTSVPMTGTIKGKQYNYTGTEARCAVCDSLVYVPEIADANLKALYCVFRDENNIIPLDDLRNIPEKYAIGNRPLSLLLGWGEHTFNRYFEGDIPTRQYSDILMRIYKEPKFYSDLLEANRGNLSSDHTYQKSRRAVDALLTPEKESGSKIDSVIHYLLTQCEDVTPMALQKALYYVQGFFYAFYKSFLFSEDCEAWVHGPVYRDIYFRYRDYCYDPIEKVEAHDALTFTAGEIAVFDSVLNSLCCYSGKVLERFTHVETPWLATRGNLSATATSNRVISKKLIGEYFEAVRDKYNMVNPSDIKDYAQEMFQQI